MRLNKDHSALLKRIRMTPEARDKDLWMLAVMPSATDEEKVGLRRALKRIKIPAPSRDPQRIPALQRILKDKGLRGFIVPRADAYQGESIAVRAERLQWLTGFSGSAGLAVVLDDEAALFVDGRYTLQAPAQTDAKTITCRNFRDPPAPDWLAGKVRQGDRIGYDPLIHSVRDVERWHKALAPKGAVLVPLKTNPIDSLWRDQPGAPFAPVLVHPLEWAGESLADKQKMLAAELAAKGVDAVVLNQLDSIAWLLNVRGGDTPSTPLVESFLVLHADGTSDWYVEEAKFTPQIRAHLGNHVSVRQPDALLPSLKAFSQKKVLIDPETMNSAIAEALKKARATLIHGADPVVLPRARKNSAELAGTRAAHLRDGAALVRFLSRFDSKAAGKWSELQVMDELEAARAEDPTYRGASFTTIAGSGPNGAIVHYRSTPETNRLVEEGTLFLLDSGGQYCDGTTDITRTLAVGEISPTMKKHFTLVLKGHIAVSTARFPKGTNGVALDGFARRALWAEGLNFDHGTGHGVGVYLGVHEGPARLSPMGTVPLEVGMILSNEPGYYETGSHGIRIENLVLVREDAKPGFLSFETLTFCPIDRRAIDVALLTPEERAWLNLYHAEVREKLTPLVSGRALSWLTKMTKPL